MKTTVWISCLTGMLLIFLTTMASAQTIYEHGLSQTDNEGFMSNIDGDLSADNFKIGSDFLIHSITWYGMYESASSGVSDTFDVRLYNSSVKNLLFVEQGMTSVKKTDSGFTDAYGEVIYAYEAALSGWEISSGEYVISISNENSDSSNWFWANSLGGDGITYYSNGGPWIEDGFNPGFDLAFSLGGEPVQPDPVPEPGTILLFGLALLITAFVERTGRYTERKKI